MHSVTSPTMPTASAPLETADLHLRADVGRALVDRDHVEADARRLVDHGAEHLGTLNGGRHVLDEEVDLLQAVLLGAERHGAQVGREATLEVVGAWGGELGRRAAADRDVGNTGSHDGRHLGGALPRERLDHGDDTVLHHVVGTGLAAGRRRLVLADVEGDLVAGEAAAVLVHIGHGRLGALLNEGGRADGAAATAVGDHADGHSRLGGGVGRLAGWRRGAGSARADRGPTRSWRSGSRHPGGPARWPWPPLPSSPPVAQSPGRT